MCAKAQKSPIKKKSSHQKIPEVRASKLRERSASKARKFYEYPWHVPRAGCHTTSDIPNFRNFFILSSINSNKVPPRNSNAHFRTLPKEHITFFENVQYILNFGGVTSAVRLAALIALCRILCLRQWKPVVIRCCLLGEGGPPGEFISTLVSRDSGTDVRSDYGKTVHDLGFQVLDIFIIDLRHVRRVVKSQKYMGFSS
ncbi:hypothetical protein EVAR_8397_1 [Eumeta japonica]|uniref:Uncharacterized protein n=1 Tax=Eumeta variegata TaxID=151549 RepID=A0A4C2AJC3_EUMVA|nr:hypothetical protein EVAR_8397_1 [Eumeta japonica]